MKKVSIIIPVYNRQNIVIDTLINLKNQSYQDWECLIIDDFSEDDTVEEIKSFIKGDHRFQVFLRKEGLTKGANSCRNYGFSLAEGKYVKWMDSDDFLVENALELQVAALENRPESMVCLGYGYFFDHLTGKRLEKWSRRKESKNYLLDHISYNIRWPIGAILWKKSFFIDPPFNIHLKNSQEWLMHSEALLRLQYHEIFNLKEDLYLARRGHQQINSKVSVKYYLNQAKSRIFLFLKMIEYRKWDIKVYFELIKRSFIFFLLSINYRVRRYK